MLLKVANLLKFYEGGLNYSDVVKFTFNDIISWEKFALKINAEIKSEINRGANR